MENEVLMDSGEESFVERINCDTDILNESEISNDGGKSETEAHFEYLEGQENQSNIQFVSVPVIQEGEYKVSWTRQMTKALIAEYTIMLALFRNSDKKQKDLWTILAEKLQQRGYKVTWQMCDRKFRNLKQTYRTIYYSDRSEKSKRRWEFYDDLSALVTPYSRFNIRRVASPDTSPNITQRPIKVENRSLLKILPKPPINSSILQVFSTPDINYQTPESYLEECESETPLWFKKFLVKFKSDQDHVLKNIQTMHNETKELELRKIGLLENVLTLLKEKKS